MHTFPITLLVACALLAGGEAVAAKPKALTLTIDAATKSAGLTVVRLSGGDSVAVLDGQTGSTVRTGSLFWQLPADFVDGYYQVRFLGSATILPTLGSQVMGKEPYFLETSKDRAADSDAPNYSYVDPASSPRELAEVVHPQLNRAATVEDRIGERPMHLEPGMTIFLRLRYPFVVAGSLKVTPLENDLGISLRSSSLVPYNMVTEKLQPAFRFDLQNVTTKLWSGRLDLEWMDLYAGTSVRQSIRLQVPDGRSSSQTATLPDPRPGAYTLVATLHADDGALVTRAQRYLTFSPAIDSRTLPADWPFGFHLRPIEPMIPPVGFRWIRVFWSWSDMQPSRDVYRWSEMDELVRRCKANGQKILWVCEGVPKWASSSPLSAHPSAYPPSDWNDVARFLDAFWARYAPDGKLDTVQGVEIWNEPNVIEKTFPPSAYATLSETIFKATKRDAPGATVVGLCESGGLHMRWINAALDAGAGKWMDAASLHNYEVDTPKGVVSLSSKTTLMQEALRNHGLNLPLWNTEAGVSSEIRNAGRFSTQEELNKLYLESGLLNRSSPTTMKLPAPGSPTLWRNEGEREATAYLIRATAQQLATGVKQCLWFKWQAGPMSWVQDWADGGNCMPRLVVPAQAILSEMWMKYGGQASSQLDVKSPDPRYDIYAYRFTGAKGSMTIVFSHPSGATSGTTDPRAGELAPTDAAKPLGKPSDLAIMLRTQPPPKLAVELPGSFADVFDMLGRKIGSVTQTHGMLAIQALEEPIYVVEPNR
ncbi:MAG: hypothetical protein P4L33_21695 [Capsulimonadaceae bacterium]|nr:hypothetical protein [Capsulimonadaceae bacterium]